MMKAVIKNRMTGEEIAVTAKNDHPSFSYGQYVWVDDSDNAYFQIGALVPIYRELSIDISSATREEIGQLIRAYRVQQSISIRDFADLAGIQPSTVQNVEKGSFTPRLDVLQRMLSALGKSIQIV